MLNLLLWDYHWHLGLGLARLVTNGRSWICMVASGTGVWVREFYDDMMNKNDCFPSAHVVRIRLPGNTLDTGYRRSIEL